MPSTLHPGWSLLGQLARDAIELSQRDGSAGDAHSQRQDQEVQNKENLYALSPLPSLHNRQMLIPRDGSGSSSLHIPSLPSQMLLFPGQILAFSQVAPLKIVLEEQEDSRAHGSWERAHMLQSVSYRISKTTSLEPTVHTLSSFCPHFPLIE